MKFVCNKCRTHRCVIDADWKYGPCGCPYYNDNGMMHGWKEADDDDDNT